MTEPERYVIAYRSRRGRGIHIGMRTFDTEADAEKAADLIRIFGGPKRWQIFSTTKLAEIRSRIEAAVSEDT